MLRLIQLIGDTMELTKHLIAAYLDYMNNYPTVEKFAEHNQISNELARFIIKEGRIKHDLQFSGFNQLDEPSKLYLETKMIG